MSAVKPSTKVTTLAIDERMAKTLDELREYMGASSNAEVFRRSIALMKLATDVADAQKQLVIRDSKDETLQRVPLGV